MGRMIAAASLMFPQLPAPKSDRLAEPILRTPLNIQTETPFRSSTVGAARQRIGFAHLITLVIRRVVLALRPSGASPTRLSSPKSYHFRGASKYSRYASSVILATRSQV
jgi:hypothetical protein